MSSKSNKINVRFKIDSTGQLNFSNNAHKKLLKFRRENCFEDGEMTLEIASGPHYCQHKYYRGHVLKYIVIGMGELEEFQDYVHNLLKREFLYFEVDSEKDIPERHRSRCKVFVKEIDGVEKVVAYVPSTATLSFDEMQEFIVKCEHRRDGLTGWSIETEDELREMIEARKLAFKKP